MVSVETERRVAEKKRAANVRFSRRCPALPCAARLFPAGTPFSFIRHSSSTATTQIAIAITASIRLAHSLFLAREPCPRWRARRSQPEGVDVRDRGLHIPSLLLLLLVRLALLARHVIVLSPSNPGSRSPLSTVLCSPARPSTCVQYILRAPRKEQRTGQQDRREQREHDYHRQSRLGGAASRD